MFVSLYQKMKQSFQQRWFTVFFKNTALGKLLNQNEAASPWVFFNTYCSSWWWIRLGFRLSCQDKILVHQFDLLVNFFRSFRKTAFFSEDNLNQVIMLPECSRRIHLLTILQRARIFTQENLERIVAHQNLPDLGKALYALEQTGLLIQENFSRVVTQTNVEFLSTGLYNLRRAGILTQEIFDLSINHANPDNVAFAFFLLKQIEQFTPVNRDFVLAYKNPRSVASVFYDLHNAGILTDENRDLALTHNNCNGVANGFCRLQEAGILTHENRDLVTGHPNPYCLAIALCNLHAAGILTPENQNLVVGNKDLVDLALLSGLRFAGRLNQENLNALVAPSHKVLLTQVAYEIIWSRIPWQFVTQADFQRLLLAAEHDNPLPELQLLGDQILGRQVRAQNTHTASVHRTVSNSARKLMKSYGRNLNIELMIREIVAYVNDLDDGVLKHQAAKRCIQRITDVGYTFTDPASGISIRELLALSYLAIHDKTKCGASLEDAKDLFIQGLYESQRGYNLDDLGQDNGGNDSPICVSGTFNKLMEKLNGIHQDVEILYITDAGASDKFQFLAQKHAKLYLQLLASSERAEDYFQLKNLIGRMKEESNLEAIWDKIKEVVKTELWAEFKQNYISDTDPKFLDIIEYGAQVAVPDLTDIDAQLMIYLNSQPDVSLAQNGFWASPLTPPGELENQSSLTP